MGMPCTARAALEGGWFEGNVRQPAAHCLHAAGVKANFIASAQNGAIIAVFVESVCHLFFRCKKTRPRAVCGQSGPSAAFALRPIPISALLSSRPDGRQALSFEPEKEKT